MFVCTMVVVSFCLLEIDCIRQQYSLIVAAVRCSTYYLSTQCFYFTTSKVLTRTQAHKFTQGGFGKGWLGLFSYTMTHTHHHFRYMNQSCICIDSSVCGIPMVLPVKDIDTTSCWLRQGPRYRVLKTPLPIP